MKPKFKSVQDGLVIVDPIERQHFQIKTQTPVTPIPTDTDKIPYPMDAAVKITTSGFTLPIDNVVYVRNPDKSLITEIYQNEKIILERAEYILDISGSLKVYVKVNSSARIHISVDQTKISFDGVTELIVSARSHQTHPTATITTTPEPINMMRAVSMFGSALKSTTTERSYPTLRGHPPSIKLGDELEIPEELTRPNTGVQIKIPPTYRHIFIVAPLVYYLAAEIVPGSTPQLVTDTGYVYEFGEEEVFESVVEKALKQVFLLDCVVQTEGKTPTNLYERKKIKPRLKFDIETVYEQTMAEQLETYLEVPFTTIEPLLPKWWLETQLEPTAEHVEYLPFAANDFSAITITEDNRSLTHTQVGAKTNMVGECSGGDNRLNKIFSNNISIINQYWNDEDGSVIPSTKPLSAFHHRVNQSPREGSLEIEVICNDANMSEELVKVHETYGDRDDLPFEVTIHHDLSKNDLKQVLTRESDFVHYIGHINSDGFRCSDGMLDAATVESVGTKAFFLNACQSYEQGFNLIKAGAIGGIVTLAEVKNSDAVDAGETIAQLLNIGFPLYATLDVFQKKGGSSQQYHILGDGMLTIVQSDQPSPEICTIIRGKKENRIKIETYISPECMHGSLCMPYVDSIKTYRIISGKIQSFPITDAETIEFFNSGKFPVLLDNELRWSNEIKTHEL
ncbi:hypothetical protein [Natronorubrum halophilum]|uniref:hypothetical protein n=1 Tax=Natronorubrum halophilum TaxID=1702106 RepID=UPI001EE94C4B|nr:hypothetical protein [Natronorubrum halophilum]